MGDQPIETDSPEQSGSAMLVDPKTVFLAGIFILLTLVAIRTASDIIIPVVLAFILKLAFIPVQRFLENLKIPRFIAALIVVFMLVGGLATVGTALSGPATVWVERLSDSLPKLQGKLRFLSDPVESAQKFINQAETMTSPTEAKVVPVAVQGTRLYDRVFLNTRELIFSFFATVLMLYFLLLSGDNFLRRLVEVLPRFKDKRQVVDISQQIEQDVSQYLLTITFMNAMVGLFTGIVMMLCGLENAMLWGILAFALNYAPILGPMIGFIIFVMVGLLLNLSLGSALLPAVLYMAIHIVESSFITPLLLARRFTLSPVIIILSLLFWYWMWGVIGAVLAIPLLAIIKIICDRIERMRLFGHFLSG